MANCTCTENKFCEKCTPSLYHPPELVDKPARTKQVGGDHYGPGETVQAIDLILDQDLGMCEGSAIKYLCRWRKKGGIQDLEKAIHYIEMLIEHEASHGSKRTQ